jgi:S-(hydroxymethyl)glutathione dehydrogenase / alcohol dehydrogenase
VSTCPRTDWPLARGQGATDTWIGGPETVAKVLEETGGFGADYTFEATGLVP